MTMRYVVAPQNRRVATDFIYTRAFERIQARKDIVVACETMDVTYYQGSEKKKSEEEKAA
jgi:hypothetical protein